MPNRIIKESICSSETIDRLNSFQETFFYRLIVNCDDYGCMDARPSILKARLYPLKERVTLKDIEGALKALADSGCVKLYTVDMKPYLCLPTWKVHQQIRAKKRKYPAPDWELKAVENSFTADDIKSKSSDNTCNQLISDDCICPRNPIQSESESNPNPNAHEDALLEFDGELRKKLEEWLRYKSERRETYKPTGLRNFISEVQNKRKVYTDTDICKLIGQCMANGWKGIIWDRLERVKSKQCQTAQTAGSSLDYGMIDALIDDQFDQGKQQGITNGN